jgi:hypothetical protein
VAVKTIGNIVLVTCLLQFMFAVIGVQLFKVGKVVNFTFIFSLFFFLYILALFPSLHHVFHLYFSSPFILYPPLYLSSTTLCISFLYSLCVSMLFYKCLCDLSYFPPLISLQFFSSLFSHTLFTLVLY